MMIAKLQWSNGVGRRRSNKTKNVSPTSLVILVSMFVASWNATTPRTCLEFLEPMRGKNASTIFDSQCRKEEEKTRRERERERKAKSKTRENTESEREEKNQKVGAREARTLDLRISRSYETYALANCATAPDMKGGVLF